VQCEAVTSSGSLLANIFQILQLQQTSQEDALTTLHKFLTSTPLLLVLDNFETPWDESKDQRAVKTILQKIAAVNHVTLIITMRGTASPLGVSWTPPSTLPVLSPLSLEGAQSVFHAITGKSEPKHEIDLLLMELDCVPLAVVLLAQLAKYQSISSLLQQWRTHKTGLLHDQSPNSDRLTSIEISISLSLKSSSMTVQGPDAGQLLALISHLPDGVLKWEERLENLTILKNIPQIVGTLTKVALAYIDMSGTLKVLSPVRQYMLNKERVEFDHIAILEKWYINFVDQYSKTPFGPTFPDAAQSLMPEIGNITSVLKYALHTHPSEYIVYAAVHISEFLCMVQPSEEILQEIFPVLENLHMEENKPYCTWLLGDILYRQFKYKEARGMLWDALAQSTITGDQLGRAQCSESFEHNNNYEARKQMEDKMARYSANGYQHGRALCFESLGDILHMEHKYSEAREKLEDALAQHTANGYQRGRAGCLWSLGEILRMEHKYSEAREKLADALAQYTANGDQQGRAHCLWSLGEILRMEYKYSEARVKLEDALTQYTANGDQQGRAQCLQSLGNILHMEHKYSEAREKLEESLAQYTDNGDQEGKAGCLQSLGDILRMNHKYSEAREKLEDALAQFTANGYQQGRAHCLWSLGDMLRMEYKYSEAREKLEDAFAQFTANEYQQGKAQCLQSLGNILHMEHKYSEAREKLEDALAQYTANGDQQGRAGCLCSLGDILCMEHKYSEARETLEEALTLYTAHGHEDGRMYCLQSLQKVNHL